MSIQVADEAQQPHNGHLFGIMPGVRRLTTRTPTFSSAARHAHHLRLANPMIGTTAYTGI